MKKQKRFFDVRPPSQEDKPDIFSDRENSPSLKPPKERKDRSGWRRGLIIFVVVFVLLYGARGIYLNYIAKDSVAYIYGQLQEARQALANFDPEAAKEAFIDVDAELRAVEAKTSKYGFLGITSLWTRFTNKFKSTPLAFTDLTNVSASAIAISDDITYLKNNAFSLMNNEGGEELIKKLGETREKLITLAAYVDTIEEHHASLIPGGGTDLFKLKTDLLHNAHILASLIEFLDTETERRVAVIFQNPSEMRPGGGFIGSYADVGITRGNLTTLTITDIYDPDGQLDLDIIPPEPMQTITPIWEARDANWFFDFPSSAKKFLFFLNNSKIYTEKEVEFEAVLALNTNFIEDVVSLLGPIELPEYDLVLDGENFLEEIQREVEAGEDKKRGEPKRILKVLTPILFEKIENLSEEEKQALISLVEENLDHKNAMVYFTDRSLQFYVKSTGAAGDVFNPSRDIISEYLAVVNANLGGQKTDRFIKQDIYVTSTIGASGKIFNELLVSREHNGQNEKEWWYNATNKNYLQIYTPLASSAIFSSGRSLWPKIKDYDYDEFTVDSDVEEIAKTTRYLADFGLDRFIAHNKTVFAGWFNTRPGQKHSFTLEYFNPKTVPVESEGSIPYQFIFERQSGASTSLSIYIQAPPQHIFKEVNSSFFELSTENPPGRLIVPLTLIPRP